MDENRLLLSRIDDLVYKTYIGEYESLGFLNEIEASVAHNYLNNLRIEHYFFGGYPQADRVFLYFIDTFETENGIEALSVKFRTDTTLSHRDFLGALMGLGIKRECVGDIIIYEDKAIVFVRSDISSYVCQNLTSVGRYNVEVEPYNDNIGLITKPMSELEVVLTSMRIDNFITSVCKCSRSKANEFIDNDYVFVNYSCINKPSKIITDEDIISIKGFGKYKIGDVLRNTKSGRLVLSVLQYK